MRTEGPIVSARAVSRTYRDGAEDVAALRNVEFELQASELVALVGPSGSGKTTLLNLLCGWEPHDAGELEWRAGTGDLHDRPWHEVALVPQALGLLEDLTIRENVMLPARLSGVDRAAVFDRLVAALGLERILDRRARETSLGEQQRSAIARALLLEPTLLLADEPTAHQDDVSQWRADPRLPAKRAGSRYLLPRGDPQPGGDRRGRAGAAAHRRRAAVSGAGEPSSRARRSTAGGWAYVRRTTTVREESPRS
ncbi:MAG TPA: ATP-binding cassette domain-containing protein [Mycobacteriales bacterium]|nr:ATP-binding cassette domain-containing protein [Mycobacteriales bacterium]